MLHVSTPTDRDIATLFAVRSDACVSITVRTTPITPDVGASRIVYANSVRDALSELEARGLPKRRRNELKELLEEVRDDDDLWAHQANTFVVLATPDEIRTFRLANHLDSRLEVSDRFDLKPLLRATTFEHAAYVVALSEAGVRLVEVFSDLPPEVIEIPDLPGGVEEAGRKPRTRQGGVGDRGDTEAFRKRELAKYCRRIDAALAPALRENTIPVIVMAVEPIASIFHHLCSAANLLPQVVSQSPDRLTPAQIAAEARKVLEAHYAERVADLRELYERRLESRRTTDDLAEVARAATAGAVETLFVDVESDATGTIDEGSGTVTPGEGYGLVSEITRRALATGAKVVALRRADLPGRGEVSATLRFAG